MRRKQRGLDEFVENNLNINYSASHNT